MDPIIYTLDEHSPLAESPPTVSILLKPHQRASLHRMIILDKDCGMTIRSSGITVNSNVGYTADLAGYGKTITFLAMIDSLREIDMQWLPNTLSFFRHGYGISTIVKSSFICVNTSLIVVPDNLIDHWQGHIDKYTDLTYETVRQNNCCKIFVDGYDIILCPARFYNVFCSATNTCIWNRVAFDEADSINIPNTKQPHARFIWLISSTYENIPNRKNKGFLRDVFGNISSSMFVKTFCPVVVKGTNEFVKKSFNLIEPLCEIIRCVQPAFIDAIKKHITPHVLELVSAGDIDSAIVALGGNIDNDRNIIELVTRSIKNNIIKINGKLQNVQLLDISAEERAEKIKKLTDKKAALEERKTSLEKSIANATTSDCSICYDNLSGPTVVPCCNNIFCAKCLINWLKTNATCPLCRAQLNDSSTLYTINSDPTKRTVPAAAAGVKQLDKIDQLIKIIKNNPDGKFLIFSVWSKTFTAIQRRLKEKGFQSGALTTTLKTESTLEKFRTGKIKIILLDSTNNGAGIEIPQATDIIIFHEMAANLEIQSIARAQRPGRIGQLRVWKLAYSYEYKQVDQAS